MNEWMEMVKSSDCPPTCSLESERLLLCAAVKMKSPAAKRWAHEKCFALSRTLLIKRTGRDFAPVVHRCAIRHLLQGFSSFGLPAATLNEFGPSSLGGRLNTRNAPPLGNLVAHKKISFICARQVSLMIKLSDGASIRRPKK